MQVEQNDLTKGKFTPVLLKFAMPIILMNFLHAFYGITDLFIIGHWVEGSAAMSGVVIGFSLMFMCIVLIFGISGAGTIMVGRAFGAKELDELDKIVGTMMTVFSIIGLILGTILFIFAPYFAYLMQTPPEAVEYAVTYARICSVGVFFIALLNMVGSVLRGLGNSKTPLLFVFLSVVLNIILDLLFICVFEWGVTGAAAATTISDAFAFIFVICYLRRKQFLILFRLSDFAFVKDKAKEMFKLGLPISSQDFLVHISFLFIFSLANRMGVAESAAYGIGERLYEITMLPAFSFGLALSAITAQNMGGGYIKRAKSFLYLATLYSTMCCVACFLVQYFFPEWVMGFFTEDKATIEAGKDYLSSSSFELILISLLFCFMNFFNGCGHTTFTMLSAILVTFLVRVPMSYFLVEPEDATLYNLGWAAVIAGFCESIVFLIYFRTKRWVKYTVKS